jgi:Putative prokaryotic signal transducing protein
MDAERLVCPGCGLEHPSSERFCRSCELPLVVAAGAESEAGERRRRARKIKPQYAEGELVKVARGANRAEAEFIANLLLEEGIPSMLRSSFGAPIGGYASQVGARDVLVPLSGAQAAREALAYRRPSG